jgi:hypothetical protein
MKNLIDFLIGLGLMVIIIAFVGAVLSMFVKVIFFLRYNDSFKHIYKFGLIGGIIGLAIMYLVLFSFQEAIRIKDGDEKYLGIPFYFMAVGIVYGTIHMFRKKRKEKAIEKRS